MKISELNHNLRRLQEEETHLGRLVITGKMREEVYDQLRAEWLEKIRNVETSLNELSQKTDIHLDDLEVALVLMTKLPVLYERLNVKNQTTLLRILAKRIIVNTQGKIVEYQLNTPFEYLATLVRDIPGYTGGSIMFNTAHTRIDRDE